MNDDSYGGYEAEGINTPNQFRPVAGVFMSTQIDKLAAALSKAQGQIKSAAKDSTNPHFKSKYADLASLDEASKEALAKNGLAVVQLPRANGRSVTLVYALLHESGQFLGSDLTMTAQQDTPQAIGSCITYQRRYSKAALVGISQDDDDGNSAQGLPAPKATSKAVDAEPVTAYDGETTILKNQFLSIAKKLGILKIEDLQAASRACKGLQMVDLEAALKEWKQDNKK